MLQTFSLLFSLFYLLTYSSEKTVLYSQEAGPAVSETSGYSVIWSVPFQMCVKTGAKTPDYLRNAGILVNDGNTFQGDKVTTFYTLGLYPYIGAHGKDFHGGIPQLADLDAHLKQANSDIQRQIPNSNFSGLALIDWEAWRPVWEFNFGSLTVYQKRSVELVRQEHPDWPLPTLVAEATRQWETAARTFMESTLRLAKRLRPKASWCFYAFPDCYNYNGDDTPETFFCSGNIMQGNNKLQWLWDQSSALCPSIYVRRNMFLQYNLTQRSWYTYGRLQESFRVGGYAKPIYPYVNYFIIDAEKTVPKEDFTRLLSQPKSLGMAGVVIWGSSKNVQTKTDCQVIDQYVQKVIVPSYSVLQNRSHMCAQQFCQGSQRLECLWTKPVAYEAWKMLAVERIPFNTNSLTCIGNISPVNKTIS